MTPFSALPVHPTLAAALARRGYETATPVQAAVLDPALAGRDLLVSSQTGSGKTVAFGMLLAETLCAEQKSDGGAPRGLVVAPTRELAAQVRRELGWLFAETRLRLAAFTGGTALGPDLRILRGGLDLVVGTPGRLVDLHRRGVLDLSALQSLVIDEADEMLDLGFKEDLEYLLAQAPAERRTLLFSATIPPEIARLATTYQRDAARIDLRAPGRTQGHVDIRYVAHLIRPSDRLAAVVNLLLAAGQAKAIVFCRTREGVGELHQRLVDHGFRAAAIAGDRAQGERDRALEALRSGRVRVLVATNVAARGLDLPDVELIVHANLPENADALTHRSGRTGRAGRKGTSVVIAEPAERRKAERQLAAAGLRPEWTPAPGIADVHKVLQQDLARALIEEARVSGRPAAEADTTGMAGLEDQLRATLPERVLLSVLLRRELDRLPAALPLAPVDPTPRRSGAHVVGPREERPTRGRSTGSNGPGRPDWGQAVIFRVNLGLESKAQPSWLLPLICRRGGVTRREVGAIRVGPRSSTFEIAAEAADDFALASSRPDPRAPHVHIEPAHTATPPTPDRSHPPAPRKRPAGPPGKPAGPRPKGPRSAARPLRRPTRA